MRRSIVERPRFATARWSSSIRPSIDVELARLGLAAILERVDLRVHVAGDLGDDGGGERVGGGPGLVAPGAAHGDLDERVLLLLARRAPRGGERAGRDPAAQLRRAGRRPPPRRPGSRPPSARSRSPWRGSWRGSAPACCPRETWAGRGRASCGRRRRRRRRARSGSRSAPPRTTAARTSHQRRAILRPRSAKSISRSASSSDAEGAAARGGSCSGPVLIGGRI